MRLVYDEISPITNNKSVLVEHDENGVYKLCMDTGYAHQEKWTIGSDELIEYESTLPQMTIDDKFVASNGDVWFRITIISSTAMLYYEQNDWIIVGMRDLDNNDDINTLSTFIWGDKIKVVMTSTPVTFEHFIDAFDNFNTLIDYTI